MDRRQHSSILDIGSFMGAECDIGHYLVVAKFTQVMAVSKQATKNVDMERLNLRKLRELENRIYYWIKISNRFAVLENWDVLYCNCFSTLLRLVPLGGFT